MLKSESFHKVKTVSPAAPYIGGKRLLSGKIVSLIEATPHAAYCEPFVGMGGVFLRRTSAARVEVVNDYSHDVATFFRVLQRHYVAFLEMLRFQITTRAEFERLLKTDPATLTDLERAARFLYLQRCSFGGKVRGRLFGVSLTSPGRFDVTKLGPVLEAIHERLAGVVIECLPWADFILRYDRPTTLFYLDPPYWGNEKDYGEGLFARADFERMADLLSRLKGRFILSLNDKPEVRRLFKGFKIESVKVKYSVGGAANMVDAREVIIRSDSR
jgi:DNA adenine methylase